MSTLIKASLAMMVAASTLSCGSASAMGRAQAPGTPAITGHVPVDVGAAAGGGFDNGYELGLRNGGILTSRLKQRTTDQQGCGAVDQLQDALLRVSRTVRSPRDSSDSMVAGFYTGYLDAIRGTIQEVRDGCDISRYTSGEFAGALYGAVACQVVSISVDALSSLSLKPLYTGWSGGSSSVQSSCRTELRATVQSCSTGGELNTSIEAAIRLSCSDI